MIEIAVAVGITIVVVCYINKIIYSSRKFSQRESITQNPPTFFDLQTDKVIRFKIDDEFNLEVEQLSAEDVFSFCSGLSQSYSMIAENASKEIKSANEHVLKIKDTITYYNYIILLIHNITKKSVDKKLHKKYFKALHKKALSDINWLLRVCEEILDFWQLTKKKILILGMGTTLRQMYGEALSWGCFQLDGNGRLCVKSRYG